MKKILSCIYSINDENGNALYVGSSCNLNRRIFEHKSNCNNENSKSYNITLYEYIRNNGGFDNYKFNILETVEDKKDKLIRERYWYEELKPPLNSQLPIYKFGEKNEINKVIALEYYKNNKDKSKINHKKWVENNRDRMKELNKKYASKIVKCDCGKEMRQDYYNLHKRKKICPLLKNK